ncbi:MAG: tRNA epoxyqueuosine(34) reductase QueG, partial [bacterium]|nr:tRNA epoxyqueuosine(34) reductase QueG [bacterium]
EREEPERLLPDLKSIVVLAHPYDPGLANSSRREEANISRYAWGEDYHEVLGDKLRALSDWLRDQVPQIHCFPSVDAQPVLEKGWAAKAGIGWLGKHTNLIDPDQGSYFFISVLLTNFPFSPDAPEQDHCGTCRACMDVCPTGAIVAPYILDAALCISYLTIELKGPIPRELRPAIGNRIFGCDDCQEVCPWNRFSRVTGEERFHLRNRWVHRPLVEFLSLTPADFKREFSHSPMSRPKWKGMMRNVLVAIGNSGKAEWAPAVREKFAEEEPLIRGHAVWAYHRLLGEESLPVLQQLQDQETDPWVLEELKSIFRN